MLSNLAKECKHTQCLGDRIFLLLLDIFLIQVFKLTRVRLDMWFNAVNLVTVDETSPKDLCNYQTNSLFLL